VAVLFLVCDRSSSQHQKPPLVQKQAAAPHNDRESASWPTNLLGMCPGRGNKLEQKKREKEDTFAPGHALTVVE
jgi:hypothetical protein